MNPLLVKLAPYVVVAGLLFVGKCGYDANQREIGAMRERLRVTNDSLLLVKARGGQLAVQYDADTATLREELARWQALKQRIRVVPKWDTLPPDTVPGPERIVVRDSTRPPTLEEILNAADATIRSCSTALGTCEQRVTNLQAELKLTQTQRDSYKKLVPSGFQSARSTLTTAAITFGLAYLILRN